MRAIPSTLVLLLAASGAAIAQGGDDEEGCAQLTYRIQYRNEKEKQDRNKSPQKIANILEARAGRQGLKSARFRVRGDDRIVVQIPRITRGDLRRHRRLFTNPGRFEQREVAPRKIHEQWKAMGRDLKQVPKAWRAIKNDRKMSGEYDYLSSDYILVSDQVIVTGADIKYAGKSRSLNGRGWKIDFELTDEGAKKFDAAAKRLYNQKPHGLSAIILDGKIISKPVIQAEKYGGRGNISGDFTDKGADDLVRALSSGSLPVPLGAPQEVFIPHEASGKKPEFRVPQTRKQEDGSEVYVKTIHLTTDNVQGLAPGTSSPEAAVVHFYASRIRADGKYGEVLPSPRSARLRRKLKELDTWTFLEVKLLKRIKRGEDKFYIKIWVRIRYKGKEDDGRDDVTVERVGGKWLVTSPPT